MIIHSLSTHPYTDGGVGAMIESGKQFWSFWVKQCSCQVAAESNTIEDKSELS